MNLSKKVGILSLVGLTLASNSLTLGAYAENNMDKVDSTTEKYSIIEGKENENLVLNRKNGVKLDKSVVKDIKKELNSLSIDADTQNKLIKKIESGEIWDSMNPEKIKLVPNLLLTPSIEDPIKRYVFDDGSVIENSIEVSNDQSVSTRAVGFRNVQVKQRNGFAAGGFYADYNIYPGSRNIDCILAVRDSYIQVIGGTYSNKSLRITRSAENVGLKRPAEAILTADISYLGSVGGGATFHMKLHVGNDKMMSGMLGQMPSVYK